MSEKALTTTTGAGSSLDVYGAGEDIKLMAKRIKLCLPGGNRLQEHEALALAQLSIAYQLNPFHGEVWFLPGSGTMVGIKGLRKAARRQGNYWVEHTLLTPQERQELGIPDDAIAYRCLVYRSELIRQSAEAISLLYNAGMKNAAERYGYQPAVGIGYWTPGDKSRMKPDQVARKRAEAEALKVAFDLPFASEPGNGERIGYIDAEWEIVDAEPSPEAAPEPEQADETEAPAANGNGRPLPAARIRDVIRKKAGWEGAARLDGEPITQKQIPTLAGLLGKAIRREGMTQELMDKARHQVLAFLVGVDSTKALTKREASALIDWLAAGNGNAGEINEYAAAEVAAVLTEIALEQGQLEMEI